jgi:hypothetical protein
MGNPEVVKAWLTFVSSLAWPIVTIIVFITFRAKFAMLIDRLRSGELAGAKFSFNETASGYVQSRIDELAQQKDPTQRTILAGEIKTVAAILGGIHPVALAILINAAECSGTTWWIGETYLGKKSQFDSLVQAGLATIEESTDSAGRLAAQIFLTERGVELMRSIGLEPGPAQRPGATDQP